MPDSQAENLPPVPKASRIPVVIGIIISIILIVIALSFIVNRDETNKVAGMALNGWGDFIAGFAAPLALVWIVVGLYQNSHALKIQQQELHLQVEEMNKLVQAARIEARAAAATLTLLSGQDRERQKAMLPVLQIHRWIWERIPSGFSLEVVIVNTSPANLYNIKATAGSFCKNANVNEFNLSAGGQIYVKVFSDENTELFEIFLVGTTVNLTQYQATLAGRFDEPVQITVQADGAPA